MLESSWKPDWYEFHPYLQENIEALPNELCEMAHRFLPEGEQVLSIFVIPRNPYLARKKNQRIEPTQALIFTSNGILHIRSAAASDPAPQPTFLRAGDLLYAHLSLILLHDRLEMVGQVNGQLEKIEVGYNAVGHRLLEPALQQFLRKSWENTKPLPVEPLIEQMARQNLKELPTKFRNGLQNYALQPDEHLLGVIHQPPIRERLRMSFSRQIAPAALLALTDRQLIICCEAKTNEPNSYGWVFTFLPIETIDTIEVIPLRKHRMLTFHLSRMGGHSKLEFNITQSNALVWQKLWDSFGNKLPVQEWN